MMKASSMLALAAILAVIEPEVAGAQARLTAEGTEFVLHIGDGRRLRSPDLVGATFKLSFGGKDVDVTIAGVENDPHAVGGRVLLHRFVVKDASGRQTDLCGPDAEGRSRVLPAGTSLASLPAPASEGVPDPPVPLVPEPVRPG